MKGRDKASHGRFLHVPEYRNTLPDALGDPKLLRARFDPAQHVGYRLELGERYAKDYHADEEMENPITLMDMDRYVVDEGAAMDPEDAALVEATQVVGGGTRAKSRELSWLVYTKYITDHVENKDEKNWKEKENETQDSDLDGDSRETLIQDIERGFSAVQKHPVHLTKPDLKPIEVLPLLPDLENWNNDYVEVVFDYEPLKDDPRYKALSAGELQHLENRAIIKSFTVQGELPGTEQDIRESFVAYTVPKDVDTSGSSQSHHVNGGDYTWVREYKFEAGRSAEETRAGFRSSFVISMTPDAVKYSPISQRINLKRKAKVDLDRIGFVRPSKITVQRRDLTEEEMEERRAIQ